MVVVVVLPGGCLMQLQQRALPACACGTDQHPVPALNSLWGCCSRWGCELSTELEHRMAEHQELHYAEVIMCTLLERGPRVRRARGQLLPSQAPASPGPGQACRSRCPAQIWSRRAARQPYSAAAAVGHTAPHCRRRPPPHVQDYPLQPLVDDCRLLGSLLDDCLRIEVGEELFKKVRRVDDGLPRPRGRRLQPPAACTACFQPPNRLSSALRPQIERIRTLSDCAQQLNSSHDKDAGRYLGQKMASELFAMPLDEALPILRAYGHYLKCASEGASQLKWLPARSSFHKEGGSVQAPWGAAGPVASPSMTPLLPLCRLAPASAPCPPPACSLTSIAEQHHSVRTSRMDGVSVRSADEVFHDLLEGGTVTEEQLYDAGAVEGGGGAVQCGAVEGRGVVWCGAGVMCRDGAWMWM